MADEPTGAEADEGFEPPAGTDDFDDYSRFGRSRLCRQDCKNAGWVYRLEAELLAGLAELPPDLGVSSKRLKVGFIGKA